MSIKEWCVVLIGGFFEIGSTIDGKGVAMRVVVFGASGFIGSRLVQALLSSSSGFLQAGDTLTLSDLHTNKLANPNPSQKPGIEVDWVQGDISDARVQGQVFARPVDVLFHLAATLTLDAEADFTHGMQVNVHALMHILELCRAQPSPPKLVFASSISTFGGELPAEVNDRVYQSPQTSYGTHKVIAEHLIHDYTRRGFVDGRVLRFPIIVTHPGGAQPSVSDRIAGLIREPLRGKDVQSPLDPQARFAVASVDKAVESLLRMAQLPQASLQAQCILNLPALTTCGAAIDAALQRRVHSTPLGRIHWQPDESVQRAVSSWPAVFTSSRALELGFEPDASVDALIDAFLEVQP